MGTRSGLYTRRAFLRKMGMTATGLVLAACIPQKAKSTPTSSAPVQLVYQDWRTEWFPALAQDMLANFHAFHPNIRVFFTQDPDNLADQMLSDMSAGTAPDVFDGCCDFLPAWADAGYLLDLRPYIEADLDKATIDDWSPAQYHSFFTRDGKIYGLPKYHGALGLYFNKDLFDAARVEYPTYNWTYDDYLYAMEKLTIRSGNTIIQWGSMFDIAWERIQMHVNGFGGHYVDPANPQHCIMSEQPALDAMEWLRTRVWEDHTMASFLDVQNVETRQAFINQKIAMVEDGSWALKDILDGAKFRVGVAPFPTGPKKHVTLATTDGFGIYAKTKHPDAAWELLKFLVSKDYGRAMAKAQFLQPARASLIPEWINFIQQEYPQQTKDLDLNAFADGQVKGYSVTNELFPHMAGVGDIARQTWDRIYRFGKAPVSDMVGVCQQIQALQKKASILPVDCGCKSSS